MGIVAEALPVGEEARRGWRSGQKRSAFQAEKRFWEPQGGGEAERATGSFLRLDHNRSNREVAAFVFFYKR
ncbi:MAG: hypothetical protein IKK60_00985 [Clostridia bacterium]|nr:hypothetical protein [Clostridia bacterium]